MKIIDTTAKKGLQPCPSLRSDLNRTGYIIEQGKVGIDAERKEKKIAQKDFITALSTLSIHEAIQDNMSGNSRFHKQILSRNITTNFS